MRKSLRRKKSRPKQCGRAGSEAINSVRDPADEPNEPRELSFPLLRACLELDDADAWATLFLLVQQTTGGRVRDLMRRSGISDIEAEGVVLDLFVELHTANGRKLRLCRACNEAEFRAWVWQVANHFAQNWIQQRQRAARRERDMGSILDWVDRSGPDEDAIRARVEEWRQRMAPRDFARLLVLIGWAVPDATVSDRTQRRWKRQLFDRYPQIFDKRR